MKHKLKKLEDQVMVITGATSGIGLVTARMAAEKKVKLVLAARNDEALQNLAGEIRAAGGEVTIVDADVSDPNDVRRIGNDAIERFGRIDTWINNAGVSIYGKLLEVEDKDSRQLFDINFWGVVYGSKIACEMMRTNGGALINIGSVLSDRAIPIQGMYSASKHAVKAFTEALRMELENDKIPISVTLIKPAAIDTPYIDHAKSYMDVKPKNPPPVYAPEVVAQAILHCAEQPVRDLIVGGGGKVTSAMNNMPKLADKVMSWTMFKQQRSTRPNTDPDKNSLHYPMADGQERGTYDGVVLERSLYTAAAQRPILTGLTISALLGAIAAAVIFRPRP